jgi:hypothetical protein
MNTTNGLVAAALLGLASTAAVAAPVENAIDETEGGDATVSDVDHAHSLFVSASQSNSPADSLAATLQENVNHASATGNPFAHPMATTHASADDATSSLSNHASATGNPLAQQTPTTIASADDAGADLSNHASAGGGFGTGEFGSATTSTASAKTNVQPG